MWQSKISRGPGRDRKTERRRASLCNPKPASYTVAAKNYGNTVPLVSKNRPARARSPGKAILPLYQSQMWRGRLNELDPVPDLRRPRGQETPGRADRQRRTAAFLHGPYTCTGARVAKRSVDGRVRTPTETEFGQPRPNSTALTKSRNWLVRRQVDIGHSPFERQRRCDKKMHNYEPHATSLRE